MTTAMAPVVQSYESQEILNVSQDARTSPTSAVVDFLEITKRGGPVQSTNQDQDAHDPSDDDELYAVSPRTRAANNTARSAAKQGAQLAPQASFKQAHAKTSREEEPAAVARSVLIETFKHGERAHPRRDARRRLQGLVTDEEIEGQFRFCHILQGKRT